MSLETGDILIFSSGLWGHTAMCYDTKQAVHGNNARDFHLDPLTKTVEKDGHPIVEPFDQGAEVFKPPWGRIGGQKENYQASIRQHADNIMRTAKYGLYRAMRLELGSSTYGPGAYARLQKYRDRLLASSPKGVTTITCSEAVILCFQLTFLENGGPGFIKLDAAHAMPRTLAKWLRANW
jgi:hypothetical protein